MIDSIDFLTTVYEDFCSKYNLPHVSADEQDVYKLSQFEQDWLKQFVLLWDASQEDFIAYIPLNNNNQNNFMEVTNNDF